MQCGEDLLGGEKAIRNIPTKNGEIIAASAVVPAASPICSPEKPSV